MATITCASHRFVVLQEYHDNIGDLDGPEEKERRNQRSKGLSLHFDDKLGFLTVEIPRI